MDDTWRPVFSILIPFCSMFGGPYLNSWVGGLSPTLRYMLAALVGMVAGGFGSEFTAYPMHLDAGIEAGATMGLTGQKLLTMQEPPSKAD